MKYLSVIIPFYNEEKNIPPLFDELVPVLRRLDAPFEVLCIDDGSEDNTLLELEAQKKKHPELVILVHKHNLGKSAAYATAFYYSKGDIIVTIDGDMQCYPEDISILLDRLKEVDAIFGVRKDRKDTLFKKIQSKLGNGFRNLMLKDHVSDMGCPIKAIKKEALREVPVFKGMHWFLPSILKFQGYKVMECEVRHRPRLHGKSKYGIWNRFVFLFDCLGMWWWKKRCLPKDRLRKNL